MEVKNNFKNLVVIGASAGGIKAVVKSVQGIPVSVDAAFVVVMHLSLRSNCEIIVAILQKKTFLKCSIAKNGELLQKGHLYLAPVDRHLLIDKGFLMVQAGAHENRYRPSIDVLFRSAAVEYSNKTIGIILTGMLDDGTSGMWAIKNCGGLCIVQEPTEAEFPDMPNSVLNKIEADYIAKLHEIAYLTTKLIKEPLPTPVRIPESLQIEVEIIKNMVSDIESMKKLAEKSDFTCPDCGGGLWYIEEGAQKRYRCHTGHVYTEEMLGELQDFNINESVVIAIRMMEERSNLLNLVINRKQNTGERKLYNENRLIEINLHIERLKQLLMLLHGSSDT